MMMRRTETIKFGEFMGGEYASKQKTKKQQKRANMEAMGKGAIVGGGYLVAAKVMIPAMMITLPIALITRGIPAMAATGDVVAVPVAGIPDAVKEKIIHAFDPLVDLMLSLSAPIAGVMITGGALMVLVNMKEKGYSMIMSSCIGYILVQLTPMLINLLFGVGSAI
jgi:Type IV secretion system pilin